MSAPGRRDRKQPFQEARRRRQELREQLASRSSQLAPGDLVQMPLASDVVAWALLKREERSPGRWLAVPADDHVLVGPGDVPLPRVAWCGPLVLRCRHAVWLSEQSISAAQRIGLLEPSHLQAALETLTSPPASAAARETAEDPDYDAWMSRIENARAELASRDARGGFGARPRA